MAYSHCTRRTPKSHRKQIPTGPRTSAPARPRSRASAELIELTRKLMEKTIEFVSDPQFDRKDVAETIQAMRPASLDEPPVVAHAEPGLAFVTGLVQSPLLTQDEERYLFTWMNFLKSRAEQNRRRLDLRHLDGSLVDRMIADLDEAIRVRNHIVQGNLRLVVSIARKLSGSLEQMSELISEGMTPLIRSVELFDISLGYRFSTYATWAVRNQMLRWLKRVRLSPEFSSVEDAPSLENLPGKHPLTESTDSVSQLKMETVSRLLSSLSEREKLAITARFGLEGQPNGQSLADIAGQMGLSKERVRQIVLLSLSKLRSAMTYEEAEALS